jgi:hypothetical protein
MLTDVAFLSGLDEFFSRFLDLLLLFLLNFFFLRLNEAILFRILFTLRFYHFPPTPNFLRSLNLPFAGRHRRLKILCGIPASPGSAADPVRVRGLDCLWLGRLLFLAFFEVLGQGIFVGYVEGVAVAGDCAKVISLIRTLIRIRSILLLLHIAEILRVIVLILIFLL